MPSGHWSLPCCLAPLRFIFFLLGFHCLRRHFHVLQISSLQILALVFEISTSPLRIIFDDSLFQGINTLPGKIKQDYKWRMVLLGSKPFVEFAEGNVKLVTIDLAWIYLRAKVFFLANCLPRITVSLFLPPCDVSEGTETKFARSKSEKHCSLEELMTDLPKAPPKCLLEENRRSTD